MNLDDRVKSHIKDNLDKDIMRNVAEKSGMITFEKSIEKLLKDEVLDEREVYSLV